MPPDIKYTRTEDTVMLEMSLEDYNQLLMMLGFAIGAASKDNKTLMYSWLQFVNRLNAINPRYTPYRIPDEYRKES